MKTRILILLSLIAVSCKKEIKVKTSTIVQKDSVQSIPESETEKTDTIVISKKHKTNQILCDLDGDGKNETVEIVRSTNNNKSGLKITYGNGKRTDYFGLGNTILDQGFD